MLADLGDFVSFTLDPEFGTVRYGERLARAVKDFATVENALSGAYLMQAFYRPMLRAFFASEAAAPDFLLVTIPFPGCLPGALVAAQEARAAFGGGTRIIFGGGYVSTELRSLRDGRLFDYCDYLSFDAGYGSLASIIEVEAGAPRESLHRTMYRDSEGRVRSTGFGRDDGPAGRFEALEERALATVFPDYRSADFSSYLHAVDSENPMHRMWSDAPWLKYRLAHGCYWKRCTFCDTELDYVGRYVPADLSALAEAADAAASRSGVFGIHFVDEAVPIAKLLQFARINRERTSRGARPFYFWGNVRFDASWTADRCELLSASGLVAVSGGIEIATAKGLAMTDKGFDFPGLVRTLVAMKRAGLLVHAYLIYGYPGQTAGDIVDSAEAVRQLFASASWTRRSGIGSSSAGIPGCMPSGRREGARICGRSIPVEHLPTTTSPSRASRSMNASPLPSSRRSPRGWRARSSSARPQRGLQRPPRRGFAGRTVQGRFPSRSSWPTRKRHSMPSRRGRGPPSAHSGWQGSPPWGGRTVPVIVPGFPGCAAVPCRRYVFLNGTR